MNDLNVLFDISVLGIGNINPRARTGIFRVIESLLKELSRRDDLKIFLTSLNNSSNLWSDCNSQIYLQESKDRYIEGLAYVSRFNDSTTFYKKRLQIQKTFFRDTAQKREFYNRIIRFLLSKSLKAYDLLVSSKRDVMFDDCLSQKCNVFHSPFLSLPDYRKLPSSISRVITIYDLIPCIYPDFFTEVQRNEFLSILNSINLDRDWIICDSHNTKQDVLNFFKGKISEEKVFVSHLAASECFRPIADRSLIDSTLEKYGLPKSPYLLSLCTLEPRKNLPFLVKAFHRLLMEQPNLDLNLVLVGAKGWKNNALLKLISSSELLKSKVILAGYIPDEDLSAIYSGAVTFAYPSLYEGFGLPPLEAMQCGVPVITSNTSSLPEVVGDAGIMIDPTDEDSLCQAILSVVKDDNFRQSLSQKGLDRAKDFSWSRCAQKTVEVYEAAANQ